MAESRREGWNWAFALTAGCWMLCRRRCRRNAKNHLILLSFSMPFTHTWQLMTFPILCAPFPCPSLKQCLDVLTLDGTANTDLSLKREIVKAFNLFCQNIERDSPHMILDHAFQITRCAPEEDARPSRWALNSFPYFR